MTTGETRSIPTGNGHIVVATFFRPASEAKGSVLIVPAMGIGQRFYWPFAQWLAGQGFLAATFDYSGTGLSRPADLRRLAVDIIDWGQFDCSAMVETLSGRLPGKPLYWIGHSLGGQILAFLGNHEKITKAVTVAAGSGYWRENVPALRRRVWWLWYVMAPILTGLSGYFPGKRLGIVGDLPAGVMRQWRRWCLDPEYAAGAEGDSVRAKYAAVRTPIAAISFTDDELMSARSIQSLHDFYVNAPKVGKRIAPQDIGVQRVGHFGFFKAELARPLWQELLLPELR